MTTPEEKPKNTKGLDEKSKLIASKEKSKDIDLKGENEKYKIISPEKNSKTAKSEINKKLNLVEKGDKIKVEYEGRLEDGSLFSSSESEGLLELIAGENCLVPGLKGVFSGMQLEEVKNVELAPCDAYGESCQELKRDVPRCNLPSGMVIYPGKKISMQTVSGHTIPAEIIDCCNDSVTLDFNHPLAGQKLFFKLKIKEIQKSGSFKEDESEGQPETESGLNNSKELSE